MLMLCTSSRWRIMALVAVVLLYLVILTNGAFFPSLVEVDLVWDTLLARPALKLIRQGSQYRCVSSLKVYISRGKLDDGGPVRVVTDSSNNVQHKTTMIASQWLSEPVSGKLQKIPILGFLIIFGARAAGTHSSGLGRWHGPTKPRPSTSKFCSHSWEFALLQSSFPCPYY